MFFLNIVKIKKINLFGVSAKYIDHLKNEKYNSKNLDLSSIKIITSTGSPLAEESFKYVYDKIKKDVHLASIAGGTDLVGCLVLGNLYSDVIKEKFKDKVWVLMLMFSQMMEKAPLKEIKES